VTTYQFQLENKWWWWWWWWWCSSLSAVLQAPELNVRFINIS